MGMLMQVTEVMKDFEEPNGDRRQELVFIGQDLDQAAITTELNACLCHERDLRKVKVVCEACSPYVL